ncbi:MAG: right-handed parallel beta-helix repeat-containing protein [Armatimonadetes bacterium]|nr:right-handed parallel beta-helix repeat-containing protein [Armatimonadota bacterium]
MRSHCFGLLALAFPALAGPGGTYDAWLQHRDSVLKRPGLLRCYTFEGAIDAGRPIPNLAGNEGALTYTVVGLAGAPEETLTAVEGRWPRKAAVRLDRGVLQTAQFPVGPNGFTAEVWFRQNGRGSLSGNNANNDGTIISQGNGYWDGWRVTASFQSHDLGFELGRPAPLNSTGLRGGNLPAEGIWHHLAAMWDGKEMRLYLNGLLLRAAPYAGPYYGGGPPFHLGFADAGWGSMKLDIDEVTLYDHALSATEILTDAHFYAPLPIAYRQHVEAGAAAYDQQDWKTAAAEYKAAAGLPALDPDLAATARLRLGECLMAQNQSRAAVPVLAAVMNGVEVADRHRRAALAPLLQLARNAADAVPADLFEQFLALPDLPAADRSLARLSLARALRQAGRTQAAREQYDKLMQDPDTTPRQKLDVRLEQAHALREGKQLAAARQAYAALTAEPGVTPGFRSYLRLLAAGTFLSQKDWSGAKAAFTALLAEPDLPASFRLEAAERVDEIARLAAGKPARDAAASRVRLPAAPPPGAELFVAPGGSDSAAGTAQRPLASFAGAVAAVRRIRAKGWPAGGVAVTFQAGEYPITETVKLGADDGGQPGAPLTFRSAPGQAVRFSGGRRLSGFAAVTDPAVLARLPEEARGKVLQVDLRALGITDYGTLQPHGFGFDAAPVAELFWNGAALHLARWPNDGWETTGNLVEDKNAAGGFTFEFAGDRPARWAEAKDGWVYGYWKWRWADSGVPIHAVDAANHRLATGVRQGYGAGPGMPWYAYNLLDELDSPGEWYLDRPAGILYVYPPSDPAKATATLSVLGAPFLVAEGLGDLRLERLVLEAGRADGIVLRDCRACLVAGCTVRMLGGTAVTVDGGTACGVFGCDLRCLGRGGTSIKGGDRKTLTPSGHFVENCDVADFSRWDRTYTPAVWTDGVGTRIAHNQFHDSPGHAMRIEGNEHHIEYNDIHDVVYETDDQGGLDMFYNPTYRGVVIRHNFWHHNGDGTHRLMRAGIRLDDAICGVTIYGNVFYKSSDGYFGAVQIHGGKDNLIDNNLFIGCRYAVSFSPLGAGRWAQYVAGDQVKKQTTEDVDISRPPYSLRYPELAHLAAGCDINHLWRNVVYDCGELMTRQVAGEDLIDNLVTGQDPGFADAAELDFDLKPTSPVFVRLGFRPIPFGEIGLYRHPLRASWPVVNPAGSHYREP